MARNELIFENAKRTAKENNVSVEAALMSDLLVCQWKMLKDTQKSVESNNQLLVFQKEILKNVQKLVEGKNKK